MKTKKKMEKEPRKTATEKSGKDRPSKRIESKNMENENEKRFRATFDKSQIFQMEGVFLQNHYPDNAARSCLSQRTGLSESQVQVSKFPTI